MSLSSSLSLSQYSQQSGLLGSNPLLSGGAAQTQGTGQQALNPWDLQVQRDQVQLSAYGLLLAAMAGFRTSIQQLELPGFITQTTGTSSTPSVASVAISGAGFPTASNPAISGAQSGTFSLNVTTLAQAQALESGAFADPNLTVIGSGTLNITAGTYNAGPNTFTAGSAAPVNVTITNGTLNGIASAINASGAPTVASVVQDGGGYHLLLTASTTGTANTLRVLATDSDTTNTDNADGLSRLAYDPTAAVNSGKNLTQQQAAQTAAYSVNGTSAINQTNTGVVLAAGVTANLLTTGTTTITVTPDFNGTQTSTQSLISSYNTLQGTLNSLTVNIGPLAGDFLTSKIVSGLNNIVQKTYSNGSSSLTSLGSIGVNYQLATASSGSQLFGGGFTLTLGSSTLQSAFNSDPNGTVNLLSAVVQSLDSFAGSYAGGGGTLPLTLNALQRNSYVDNYLAGTLNAATQSKLPSMSDLLQANGRPKGNLPGLTAGQIQAIQQYAQATLLFSPPGSINGQLVQALFGSTAQQGAGRFSALA